MEQEIKDMRRLAADVLASERRHLQVIEPLRAAVKSNPAGLIANPRECVAIPVTLYVTPYSCANTSVLRNNKRASARPTFPNPNNAILTCITKPLSQHTHKPHLCYPLEISLYSMCAKLRSVLRLSILRIFGASTVTMVRSVVELSSRAVEGTAQRHRGNLWLSLQQPERC